MKYEIELTEEQVAELKKALPDVNLLEITKEDEEEAPKEETKE